MSGPKKIPILDPEPESSVNAVRFRLKTQEALPSSDSLSVLLLRLMAATNDVRQLQTLLLTTREPAAPPRGRCEALKQGGELLYFTRLFFGHLYEAGIAFRGLDQDHRDRVTAAVGDEPRFGAALTRVRTVFGNSSPDAFNERVLGKVRNLAAFHYKDATFREGLETFTKEAELVMAEYAGFNRYAITDAILEDRVVKATGGTPDTFTAAIGEAINLAGALENVVGALAGGLLQSRPGTFTTEPVECLTIHPALRAEAVARRTRPPSSPGNEGAPPSG